MDQQKVLPADGYMMMLGAATCSPISQLDGIDFGKVLSTRGDKTFINELTSSNKVHEIMMNQEENVENHPD